MDDAESGFLQLHRPAQGSDHFGDVRHPQPLAEALRTAMIPAWKDQPAAGRTRVERVKPGELERAFGQAFTLLPPHVLHVGRTGDHVWAKATPLTDDWGSMVVQLKAERHSLADALVAVASLMLFDLGNGPPAPALSVPEAREAA